MIGSARSHERRVRRPRRAARLGAQGVLTVLLAPTAWLYAAGLPGEYMNAFHTGYPTPHTAWAKPYAPGRIKALFIAPYTAAREVAELAQRLDVVLDGETTFSDRILGGTDRYTSQVEGTSPTAKRRSLCQKLAQPYDAIVLANFPFNRLPVEVQFHIARQVTGGTGLVLVYKHDVRREFFRHPLADAARRVWSGVPFAGLDFYRRGADKLFKVDARHVGPKVVTTYRAKKGRVVQIDYRMRCDARHGGFCLTPREPFSFRTPAQYEYHHLLVANAVVWAAGKEPPVRVGDPAWCVKPIVQARLPQQVKLVLTHAGEPTDARVHVAVRNPWGQVEWQTEARVRLKRGSNPVGLVLPHLPGGGHYLDVRVTGPAGALGWAAFWIEIEPAGAIAELAMDRLSFERTESAAGRVRLKAPCTGRGWAIAIELWDNYGRLYATRRVPLELGATEARFSVRLRDALSLAGRCRAKLTRAQQVIDQAEADFFVPKRRLDVFPTLLWGTYPGILGHLLNNKLRAEGFNTILMPHYRLDNKERGEGRRAESVARSDMLLVPYVRHITYWRRAFGDEAEYARNRPYNVKVAEWLKQFGPLVYSLGDENSLLARMGFEPGDQAGWVGYLKTQYPSLDALNRAWGRDGKPRPKLADWADARPITLEKARRLKRFAQYHDTEAYREDLYARWHHWHHDVYKSVDPHARVGAEGSQPGDLEKTIRGLEFWGPYRRLVLNTLERSLAPRTLIRGNWFGGYCSGRRDVPGLRRFLWDTFLDGNNLLEIYCCYTCETIQRTDMTMAYWTRAFLPDLREIVDGIGQLAAASEHHVDRVAVHHSQPSVHASRVNPVFGGERQRTAIHESTLVLLEDAGWQTYYVTANQVEHGALGKPGAPRALVLPYDQAMSVKEAAILKQFVADGGVLLADVCPGILDGHCTPRPGSLLDDLFGVQRGALGRASPFVDELRVPGGTVRLGDRVLRVPAVTLHSVRMDRAVMNVETGRALASAGKTPMVIVRRHGKGLAVLLNFSLQGYTKLKPAPRAGLRDLVAALLAPAGVRPFCRVVGPDGKALVGCRAPRFRRGQVTTLMLLASRGSDDRPIDARVQLANPAHVYDQRTGQYLGHGGAFKVRLDPVSATVVSLVPYRVTGVTVTGAHKVRPGEAVTLKVGLSVADGVQPTGHVFRVKVYRPDGQEVLPCARTLRPSATAPSRATVRLPFAFNDPPGQWTVLVRDVATRIQTRHVLELGVP